MFVYPVPLLSLHNDSVLHAPQPAAHAAGGIKTILHSVANKDCHSLTTTSENHN
jgi:hypothetical protein